MTNLPHYFIAIPLPTKLKDYFLRWQTELRGKLDYKLWPHEQDLHITLKFLGPVAESKLQQLKNDLVAIEDLNAFGINVGTIGVFGNPQKPRVLFAGVEKTASLATLQEMVETCAIRAGFQKENREYHPHITLAKKWAGESAVKDLVAEIKNNYIETEPMDVTEVVIYQIFPSRNPKYEIIKKYSLQDKRADSISLG